MTLKMHKPGLPDCMMPGRGNACAYVAWQADRIERLEKAARIGLVALARSSGLTRTEATALAKTGAYPETAPAHVKLSVEEVRGILYPSDSEAAKERSE